jgi:formate dehydrogenase subunit gamma
MAATKPDADPPLAALIEKHRGLAGPLLPILHAVQEEFGYVDDAHVAAIAAALNLSRAEVHGVVTFYHYFRRQPSGRHVLKLCRAESCQAMGCDSLAAQLSKRLGIAFGETTADGKVTLEAVYCLGNCALSPAAMLDGKLRGRLSDKALNVLLREAEVAA